MQFPCVSVRPTTPVFNGICPNGNNPFHPLSILIRIATCFVGSLWLVAPSALLSAAGSVCQPNILFILTDDQGWSTLGSYGNERVPTPHLDRLAAEGMRFTDAYVMPQCTPTRAALLTGQHTARNGMWHVISWYGTPHGRVRETPFRENLPRTAFTLAKGFKAAGYVTGTAGKWHLTNNADGNYSALKPEAAAHYGFDFSAPPGPAGAKPGDKHADYLTDRAIDFIAAHRSQPWFFYLAHHTIHAPVSAPESLVAKYRARGAPADGMYNATYLAAIEHMDSSVGRLLAKLDELGQREKTLVVFLSDNGGVADLYDVRPFLKRLGATLPVPDRLTVVEQEFSSAPLRAGKGSHYEGGIRVPCIVRWPGVVPPASTSDTPVHAVDWLPTLLAAAGTRAPADWVTDGVDLRPLLRGQSLAPRPLFWYLPLYDIRWGATPSAIVRDGDWKLIEFFGDWIDPDGNYVPGARLELFNLREDLSERHDQAAHQPAVTAALRSKLHAWMASVPVPVPGPNPQFDPARQLLETNQKPAGYPTAP